MSRLSECWTLRLSRAFVYRSAFDFNTYYRSVAGLTLYRYFSAQKCDTFFDSGESEAALTSGRNTLPRLTLPLNRNRQNYWR